MVALGADIRIPKKHIHGKLIITDKRVVVSSVNMNNIGLGFAKSKAKWRANTETIAVVSDKTVIDEAKRQYESEFKNSDLFIAEFVKKEHLALQNQLSHLE